MSDEQPPQPHIWAELRRHPAFQTAIVFAGASWLGLQAADIFGLETATVRAVGLVLAAIFTALVGFSVLSVLRGTTHREALTRTRMRTIIAATATLLVLGTGAWFARPYVVPAVRPGAEVIAVLPFNAAGPGVAVLGEGLVDLLSTNLNEVGLIRTINPRTTLHTYNEIATGGSIDLPGQLRVGRDVGAGSILVGSLISTGNEVRITAELYAVATGEVIAKAQQTGRPDSVLALVDQLSIQLMQDIWRSRAPMPELRVSAITTQSVPAVHAYMRGEQFYRRVQWDSAMAAFSEAVAHDSTFALAHFRLGETYGWSENLGSESAQLHSNAAARFADRLPARERTLIVAHQLHEQGSRASLDSLRAYVIRFPDDVGGHYLLADATSHAGAILGLSIDSMRAGFRRVHELDPTFAPNYAHLLELTAMAGDRASYERYLAAFRELSPGEAVVYELMHDVRWADRDRALGRIGVALQGDGVRRQQVLARVMVSSSLRSFAGQTDVEFLLATLDTLERAARGNPQAERQVAQNRANVLGSAGRMRAAEAIVANLREHSMDHALNASITLVVSGLAPADAFVPEREALERARAVPVAAYWLTLESLMKGNVAAAERHIAMIESDTLRRGFIRPPMINALRGWVTAARGDTIAGIAQMKTAILELGYAPALMGPAGPLRVQLALLQLARPETRTEGIRRLATMVQQEGHLIALIAEPLAEAYVADGQIEEARSVYARFVSLWEGADPELQPRVQAAANALARLSGERAN